MTTGFDLVGVDGAVADFWQRLTGRTIRSTADDRRWMFLHQDRYWYPVPAPNEDAWAWVRALAEGGYSIEIGDPTRLYEKGVRRPVGGEDGATGNLERRIAVIVWKEARRLRAREGKLS